MYWVDEPLKPRLNRSRLIPVTLKYRRFSNGTKYLQFFDTQFRCATVGKTNYARLVGV